MKGMPGGKSTGNSWVMVELLKRSNGMPNLLASLYNSMNQQLPQAWKQTTIVSLYKGKGDQKQAANYRGIAV